MHGVVVDCLLVGAVALPVFVLGVIACVAFARAGRELLRVRRLLRAQATRVGAILDGEARGRVIVRGRVRAAEGVQPGAARAGLLVDEWARLPPLGFVVDDGTGAVAVELGEALFDETMPRGRVLWDGDELVLEAEVARVEPTYRQAPSVGLRPAGGRALVVGRDDRWWQPLAMAGGRALAWAVVVLLGELILGGFVFAILSAVV